MMWPYLTAPPSTESNQFPFKSNFEQKILIKQNLLTAGAMQGDINWISSNAGPKADKKYQQIEKYVYGQKMPDGSLSAPPLKVKYLKECIEQQLLSQNKQIFDLAAFDETESLYQDISSNYGNQKYGNKKQISQNKYGKHSMKNFKQFQKKLEQQLVQKMNNVHLETKDFEYSVIDY